MLNLIVSMISFVLEHLPSLYKAQWLLPGGWWSLGQRWFPVRSKTWSAGRPQGSPLHFSSSTYL